MVETILSFQDNKYLRIEWAKELDSVDVFLGIASEETFIGSSVKHLLVPSLLKITKEGILGDPSGKIENQNVTWIASLTNPHTAVYGYFKNLDLVLFFQNSMDSSIYCKAILKDLSHWADKLAEANSNLSKTNL